MEKLQERGLRSVFNDFSSSYEDLSKTKLSTFHIRRMRTMAIKTFKILNGLAPPALTNLIQRHGNVYITFAILIFYRSHRFALVSLERVLSNMAPLCCGTVFFQKILGNGHILTSLNNWSYHGMGNTGGRQLLAPFSLRF